MYCNTFLKSFKSIRGICSSSHHLKMSEGGEVKGKVFGMGCMNTKVGWEVVGDGPSSGTAAVY